jgi:hypothetical protein
MGLFTMPGGSDYDSIDDSDDSSDPNSGDGSLSSLLGLNGIGSGYGITTYDDPPPPTSTASDLGSLQSGSTTASPFDINSAFADTLGAIVALDSINSQASTTGIGYYKAADGNVYQDGTGPGPAVTSAVPGNLLFWVLILGAAWVLAKDEHL